MFALQTCRYIQEKDSLSSLSLTLLKRYIIYTSLRLNIVKHLILQQCYNTFERQFSTYVTIIFHEHLSLSIKVIPYYLHASVLERISGVGLGSEPHKFKEMRHYNMLSCPQNARNPVSDDLGYIFSGKGCLLHPGP